MAKNVINIIMKGKVTCRLHRKSPKFVWEDRDGLSPCLLEMNRLSLEPVFWVSFYDDDISPFYMRSINIFWSTVSCFFILTSWVLNFMLHNCSDSKALSVAILHVSCCLCTIKIWISILTIFVSSQQRFFLLSPLLEKFDIFLLICSHSLGHCLLTDTISGWPMCTVNEDFEMFPI